MFESGKKATKQAKNTVVEKCQLPTDEQVLKIWQEHFEPLLLCSDEHDAERLQEFEKDVLSYIRNLKI